MRSSLTLAAALAAALGAVEVADAQQGSSASAPGPRLCSPQIDIASYLPGGPNEDPDVVQLNAEIDRIFAAALKQARNPEPLDPYHRLVLLGTLALFDKNLSVGKNMACTTCHLPQTGFTGGVSLFNQTIVAQPGSVANPTASGPAPNYRISARKPQSYGYSPFAPVLQYDALQRQFTGGNFWDMRATGLRLGNPAAEQAQGPPDNPVEMGLPDTACVVYRVSQSRYRGLFEQLWGAQSFGVTWPANVERVCTSPGPPSTADPLPVHLSAVDRGTVNATYDHLASSIAAEEASPDVSPFTSKLDVAVNQPQQRVLSSDELAGWQLFRGKGKCNTCHLDGTESVAGGNRRETAAAGRDLPGSAANTGPFFTDFQAHNLGVPANLAMPFYCETKADPHGFVANPQGRNYVDVGVGGFLAGAQNPNRLWAHHSTEFNGRFQTPTLRNVDLRPRPDFIKGYMHNGYFKGLKAVVHFYNTRDTLPRCGGPLSPDAGKSCWPAPEVSANEDKTIGNLGLTDHEEDLIVAFLKTLTDGYTKVAAPGDVTGASIGTLATHLPR